MTTVKYDCNRERFEVNFDKELGYPHNGEKALYFPYEGQEVCKLGKVLASWARVVERYENSNQGSRTILNREKETLEGVLELFGVNIKTLKVDDGE